MDRHPGADTINVDVPEKVADHVLVLHRKRKRVVLMEEELTVFTIMTEAMKEVAITIRESTSTLSYTTLSWGRWLQSGGSDDCS